jgi:hypothetical protein
MSTSTDAEARAAMRTRSRRSAAVHRNELPVPKIVEYALQSLLASAKGGTES